MTLFIHKCRICGQVCPSNGQSYWCESCQRMLPILGLILIRPRYWDQMKGITRLEIATRDQVMKQSAGSASVSFDQGGVLRDSHWNMLSDAVIQRLPLLGLIKVVKRPFAILLDPYGRFIPGGVGQLNWQTYEPPAKIV